MKKTHVCVLERFVALVVLFHCAITFLIKAPKRATSWSRYDLMAEGDSDTMPALVVYPFVIKFAPPLEAGAEAHE